MNKFIAIATTICCMYVTVKIAHANQDKQPPQSTAEILRQLEEKKLKGDELKKFFAPKKSDHYMGADPMKAKIVIISYGSPTCVHCADFYKNTLKQIKDKYLTKPNTDVSYIHRSFTANQVDLAAHQLLYCKNRSQEEFQAILNTLYSRQAQWAFDSSYADNLQKIFLTFGGMTKEEMIRCLNDQRSKERLIKERIEVIEKGGLRGTPTIIVNGTQVPTYNISDIDAAIKASRAS